MTNSFNTSTGTITVDGWEYNIQREDRGESEVLYVLDGGGNLFPGLEGRLGYEEDGEMFDPRDWSNVSTMLVNYRGYKLGDGENDDFDAECPDCKGRGYVEWKEYEGGPAEPDEDDEMVCPTCQQEGSITLDPATYYRQERGARVVMPLFVYEHSGITMLVGPPIKAQTTASDVRSTGRVMGDDAGWDTSFVGFIFDTPDAVRECLLDDATDEDIEAALRSEVETYASWLEGDVTWWSVKDDETNYNKSCGGYVGSHEECERECFHALMQAIEARLREEAERAYWIEREVLTA